MEKGGSRQTWPIPRDFLGKGGGPRYQPALLPCPGGRGQRDVGDGQLQDPSPFSEFSSVVEACRREAESASGQVRAGRVPVGSPSCAPVCVDEGTEAQPVTPAAGEVGDVDIGIAGRLPLAPDQQRFLGRQQGCAGPKLLLAGQDSGSPCRDRWEGSRTRRPWEGRAGPGCDSSPPTWRQVRTALSSERLILLISFAVGRDWG